MALTTTPIAKHCRQAAGHAYPGQTERLAQLAGGVQVSMLFTARSPHKNWRLNTLLATTHIPFAQVIRTLSPTLVRRQLTVLHCFCRQYLANRFSRMRASIPMRGKPAIWLARNVTGWSPA